jgi:hypothetical protein
MLRKTNWAANGRGNRARYKLARPNHHPELIVQIDAGNAACKRTVDVNNDSRSRKVAIEPKWGYSVKFFSTLLLPVDGNLGNLMRA